MKKMILNCLLTIYFVSFKSLGLCAKVDNTNGSDTSSVTVQYKLEIVIGKTSTKDSLYTVEVLQGQDQCKVEFIGNYVSSIFEITNSSRGIVVAIINMPQNNKLYIVFDQSLFNETTISGELNMEIYVAENKKMRHKKKFFLVKANKIFKDKKGEGVRFKAKYLRLKKLKEYYPDYDG